MGQDFDLLGDPIPEGFGKRGRPPHVPTEEKRKIVMMLQAFDWSIERIAAALSITPPTLRKNYFRELKVREEARARVEALTMGSLLTQVEEGNVAAIKEMVRLFDKHDLAKLADHIKSRGQHGSKPPADAKKGKKEMQREAAGSVQGKFAPPPAPDLLN
ncbi:sigma-70 region 4 domain-containing protein [Pelagibacterium limicola]|uniref:sigma-70 region 4 domain-containing protein n=1 Tax=Pelagibacterium limicola TaxID=2791022 RepID=UPI0018AF9FEB|nr:sigma-70 region 4 domain-containing protein [Pelagibacterium limicola]